MSTLTVNVEQISALSPIPGADFIELAHIEGYQAIVSKDKYKVGDYVLYLPEQCVLPEKLIKELGLEGKLSGKGYNRIKAVRLKGCVSQGVICRPKKLRKLWKVKALAKRAHVKRKDYSKRLKVNKWVPQVPHNLSGRCVPAPNLVRWIEIENIKKNMNLFSKNEEIIATEKVHGTCCLTTYDPKRNVVYVSSKGVSKQNLGYDPNESSIYWDQVRKHKIDKFVEWISSTHDNALVGVFGEIYGPGVQDMHYGLEEPTYGVFDIKINDEWKSFYQCKALIDTFNRRTGNKIQQIPIFYDGFYDYDALKKLAESPSRIGSYHGLREGLVVRAHPERLDRHGNRAIAKFVSDKYLFRKGDQTEFE